MENLTENDDALLAKVFERYPQAVGAEIRRYALRFLPNQPIQFGWSATITMPRLDKRGRKISGSEDTSGGHADTKAEAIEKALNFVAWSLNEKGVK